MRMISSEQATKILKAAGLSDDMVQSVYITYRCVFDMPKNIVDYIVALRTHGMPDEQIMTILHNSTGAMEIFDVRRFFREIAPNFRRFGFTEKRIENDIRAFDDDMQKYGHSLIGIRETLGICQSPCIIFNDFSHLMNIIYMMKICIACDDKFYRAGIEFIEWAKRGEEPDDKIVDILQQCVGPDGVDMKRLLRLTTGGPGFAGRSMVSHGKQQTIKPMVRMKNIRYACDVLNFFDQNKRKIRDIAQKYTDVDFILAFYELCMSWNGWSWVPKPQKTRIPSYKTTLRDGIGFVMWLITGNLPEDARHMIVNITICEFAKIVPAAKYESWWAHLERVMDNKQQR